MHIQVVNFRLKDMTTEQYYGLCDELAPAFANVPGLLSKVWLANEAEGVFGGVYTWRDRAAMEQFAQGEMFAAMLAHPNLAGITSRDFGVLEDPTRVTRGLAGVAV
jgi:quinol monooxygenase YgiN